MDDYWGSRKPVVSVMWLIPLGSKTFSLSVTISFTPLVPFRPFVVPFVPFVPFVPVVVPLVTLVVPLVPFVELLVPFVCGTSNVRVSTSNGASILATARSSNKEKRACV